MSEIIITNIQQARELKAAGLPLNLEVETRHWSRKTSELMFAVDKAQGKFLKKMLAYQGAEDQRKLPSQRAARERSYNAMIRAFNKFSDAVNTLIVCSEELRKTDKNQAAALRGVIEQQMVPTLAHFEEVFERLESGEEVSFHLGINNAPAVVRSESQ